MNCKETLHTQSYLDGELVGAAAAAAERHLESCADCQALAAGTADLSDALRKTTHYRAPEVLRTRISAALDRETRPVLVRRGFWLGAASGTGLSALAAGFALLALLPPTAASLSQSVTDAHVAALTGGKTIMVASSNHLRRRLIDHFYFEFWIPAPELD